MRPEVVAVKVEVASARKRKFVGEAKSTATKRLKQELKGEKRDAAENDFDASRPLFKKSKEHVLQHFLNNKV